jgi:hypothetical protein
LKEDNDTQSNILYPQFGLFVVEVYIIITIRMV